MLAEVYRGGVRERAAASARWRRSSASASTTARTSCHASSPAASSSAWRSPARSSASRACCSATSRPATSTRSTPSRARALRRARRGRDDDPAHHARRPGRRADAAPDEDRRRPADGARLMRAPRPGPPAAAAARPARRVGRRPARASRARRARPCSARSSASPRSSRRSASRRPPRNQIVGRFDAVAATDIVVSPARRGAQTAAERPAVPRRGRGCSGSTASSPPAASSDVDVGGDLVELGAGQRPAGPDAVPAPGQGGLARPLARRAGAPQTGRFPDAGHSARADRVVVLGPNAAERLNITRVDQQPAIFLGDRLYVVIGILDGVERQPSLLGAMVMPEGTAAREYGLRGARPRADRDARRRRRADRAPGADRAQPRRSRRS